MTAGARPAHVLLAHGDLFEGGYVGAVLAARGLTVLGPFAAAPEAIGAIETPGLIAAVIASPHEDPSPGGLADALGRRGIPFLTLVHAPGGTAAPDGPALARPFAAYQVADWVAGVADADRPPAELIEVIQK